MRTRAFTLAEVLITLGIIGVVAALTIPTLIANTKSQHFRAAFKKSISTLNQASRMAQARNDVNYGLASQTCGENAPRENLEDTYSFCAILNGTLAGHTFIGTLENYKINMSNFNYDYEPVDMIAYRMSDGAMVMFSKAAAGCTGGMGDSVPPQCLGFIDVNGKSKPNKIVSCNNPEYDLNGALTCEVSADRTHITDVFPVVFYDGSVLPASAAARSVLAPQGDSNVETAGIMNAPAHPIMCDIGVSGITPCSPNFNHGFPLEELKHGLVEQGMSVNALFN